MKKSKHFRKDVIIARIIAAALLIVLIVIISSLVSAITKTDGDKQKNTQNISSENSQNISDYQPDVDMSENADSESTSESESESTSESENTSRYVRTTAQVKFRSEPNTDCTVLGLIDMGTEVELLEELNGWYKVSYNGQEGYISADYSRIVE